MTTSEKSGLSSLPVPSTEMKYKRHHGLSLYLLCMVVEEGDGDGVLISEGNNTIWGKDFM